MRYPIGWPGIALVAIRVTREDLSGVDPMAAPVG